MIIMKTCIQCSSEYHLCDHKKPKCESFKPDKSSTAISSPCEPYYLGRLRHQRTNVVMTLEEALKRIQKENNIPKSNNSISSILLSSGNTRLFIYEFMNGSRYKTLKGIHNGKMFCIDGYSKKEIHEILWYKKYIFIKYSLNIEF